MKLLRFLASVWGVSDALAPEIPDNENEKLQALLTENEQLQIRLSDIEKELESAENPALLAEKARIESRMRDNKVIMKAYAGNQGYF